MSQMNEYKVLADRLKHSMHSVITVIDPQTARESSVPVDERVLLAVQVTPKDLGIIITALATHPDALKSSQEGA